MNGSTQQYERNISNRDVEELRQRLNSWFIDTLGEDSKPKISNFSTPEKAGMSSETLLFDLSWQQQGQTKSGNFVARLPPAEDAFPIFPTYDFDLQVEVMRIIGENSSVPVPRVVWYERSPNALGVPFFIMDRIEGEVAADNPPYVFGGWLAEATEAQQRRVQDQTIAVLAGIHGIEVNEADHAFLQAKQPGATQLHRNFAHKKYLYEWGKNDIRFPLIENLIEWLDANWPEDSAESVICWGDARVGNVLCKDFNATAVLDWEMAMLGPREMDTGYLIFFHKYFQSFADGAGVRGMPNFLRKFEVVETYEKLTGKKLRNIDWYITYGLLHQAVTEVRITQRRILFGEIDTPQSTDDYLFTQHLIRQVLDGQSGLWD